MTTITHTAHDAANRARLLAEVLRDRTDIPLRKAVRAIADDLLVVATAFETEPPLILDGIAALNTIPCDAWVALEKARNAAAKRPRLAYLADVLDYVFTPVTRRTPELVPCDAPDAQHYADRIAKNAKGLDTDTDATSRYFHFSSLITSHQAYAGFATA